MAANNLLVGNSHPTPLLCPPTASYLQPTAVTQQPNLPSSVLEVQSIMAPPSNSLFGAQFFGSIPNEFTERPAQTFGEHLPSVIDSNGLNTLSSGVRGEQEVVNIDDTENVSENVNDTHDVISDRDMEVVNVETSDTMNVSETVNNTHDVINDQDIEDLMNDLLNEVEDLDKSASQYKELSSSDSIKEEAGTNLKVQEEKPLFKLHVRKDIFESSAVDFKVQNNVITNGCDKMNKSPAVVQSSNQELATMDELLVEAGMDQSTESDDSRLLVINNLQDQAQQIEEPPVNLMNPPSNSLFFNQVPSSSIYNGQSNAPPLRRSTIVDQNLQAGLNPPNIRFQQFNPVGISSGRTLDTSNWPNRYTNPAPPNRNVYGTAPPNRSVLEAALVNSTPQNPVPLLSMDDQIRGLTLLYPTTVQDAGPQGSYNSYMNVLGGKAQPQTSAHRGSSGGVLYRSIKPQPILPNGGSRVKTFSNPKPSGQPNLGLLGGGLVSEPYTPLKGGSREKTYSNSKPSDRLNAILLGGGLVGEPYTPPKPQTVPQSPPKPSARYKLAEGKEVLYVDPTLPAGWFRKVSQRSTGATAGSYDVYILDPEGRRFRSKPDIRRHFEKIGETRWNWQDFDFNPFGTKNQHKMLKEPSHNSENKLQTIENLQLSVGHSSIDLEFPNPKIDIPSYVLN